MTLIHLAATVKLGITMNEIYLDNNATTPVDQRVAELVLHHLTEEFGNAGSRTHIWGSNASKVVEKARNQISQPIDAEPEDVIFTSGATESDNLAILGLAEFARNQSKMHIITTAVEHKAVLEPMRFLESRGFSLSVLDVDEKGYPSPDALSSALTSETVLVSTMHVNNETGVETPLDDYVEVMKNHDAWWHVDAAQGFGKANDVLSNKRIDMLSLSGHKMFAPKGIGALILRRRGYERAPLAPLQFGGGQERGIRPGTLPVSLIAGFGKAAELASIESFERSEACKKFRKTFLEAFLPLNPQFNGENERTLPHVVNLTIPGIDAEAVLVAVKGLISISNGSACTSSSYEPSHVLKAMGFSDERISGALRISWNHLTPDPNWVAIVEKLQTFIR